MLSANKKKEKFALNDNSCYMQYTSNNTISKDMQEKVPSPGPHVFCRQPDQKLNITYRKKQGLYLPRHITF